MRTLIEPDILANILHTFNTRMITNQHMQLIAFLSDAPVFLYPLLLIGIYLTGILNGKPKNGDQKNQTGHKKSALYLFTSTIGVFLINNIIKIFFQRPRPYVELGLPVPTEELSLSHIPTDSFPSDHAAVSMTIAMGLRLRGKRTNNKMYTRLSIFFVGISLMMGIGRITIGIHRPTDILVGYIIGIGTAFFILQDPLKGFFNRLRNMLISREKYINYKVFNYKQ